MSTEEPSSHNEEREKAVRDSFQNAGIPRLYWPKEQRLLNYGVMGNRMATRYSSGEMRDHIKAGMGYYFTEDTPETMGVFALTCRAMLLLKFSVRIYSLPHFKRIVCGETADTTRADLYSTDVIGIQGFYASGKKPFSDSELYQMDWQLRELLMDEKAFIMQGDVAPEHTKEWWSPGLIKLLRSRLVTYSKDGKVKEEGK